MNGLIAEALNIMPQSSSEDNDEMKKILECKELGRLILDDKYYCTFHVMIDNSQHYYGMSRGTYQYVSGDTPSQTYYSNPYVEYGTSMYLWRVWWDKSGKEPKPLFATILSYAAANDDYSGRAWYHNEGTWDEVYYCIKHYSFDKPSVSYSDALKWTFTNPHYTTPFEGDAHFFMGNTTGGISCILSIPTTYYTYDDSTETETNIGKLKATSTSVTTFYLGVSSPSLLVNTLYGNVLNVSRAEFSDYINDICRHGIIATDGKVQANFYKLDYTDAE